MVCFGFQGWNSCKKSAAQSCKRIIVQMIIPNWVFSRIEDLTFKFAFWIKVVSMVYFLDTRQNWVEPIRNSKALPIRRSVQLHKNYMRTCYPMEKVTTGPFEIALIQKFTNLSKALMHLRISLHTLIPHKHNYYSVTVIIPRMQ